MSAFQSRSQRRASKALQLRNERIQRFVADQTKLYDGDAALQASQTRAQFITLVTERAKATVQ